MMGYYGFPRPSGGGGGGGCTEPGGGIFSRPYYRGFTRVKQSIAVLKVTNDTKEIGGVQIRTPGGVIIVEQCEIKAGESHDLHIPPNTYDVFIGSGPGSSKTISNAVLADDITISMVSVLAGDISVFPIDANAKAVTANTAVSDFFKGDVLHAIMKTAKSSPNDKLVDVLEKLHAATAGEGDKKNGAGEASK